MQRLPLLHTLVGLIEPPIDLAQKLVVDIEMLLEVILVLWNFRSLVGRHNVLVDVAAIE